MRAVDLRDYSVPTERSYTLGLAVNVDHAVYLDLALTVAPLAQCWLVWWFQRWLGNRLITSFDSLPYLEGMIATVHGHSVSPLNPLIVSIAMVNKAMFSLK